MNKLYFQGKPCKNGHSGIRYKSDHGCVECIRLRGLKRYKEHKEELIEYQKKYCQENKEKVFERRKNYREKNKKRIAEQLNGWYLKNKEYVLEYQKEYYQNNKDKVLARNRKYLENENNKKSYREWQKEYVKEHRGRYNAHSRNYELRKKRACPSWVTTGELFPFYEVAYNLTVETGVPHEVDHIIPIKGKGVRGLHVPWNLRIITADVNRRKSNLYKAYL